jgi:ABC-2 type transport system permease protein
MKKNMQITASFKKEILAFTRTKKFLILFFVFLGAALLYPLLIKAMNSMMEAIPSEIDIGMTAEFAETVGNGTMMAVSSVVGVGLIVFLLVINSFAGGEQKRRSIIIPSSSGLRSASYILPKFIIYPLAVFLMTVVSGMAAWALSLALFDVHDAAADAAFLSSALAGVHLMLYVCMHLTIGTATGRAGMSSAICIGVSMLLPAIFMGAGVGTVYNPFGLDTMSLAAVSSAAGDAGEVMMTVVIALGIMVILYLIALFAQNARKIDNSGNEIVI